MAISAEKKVKENNKEIDWKRTEKGAKVDSKPVEDIDLGTTKDKRSGGINRRRNRQINESGE